MKAMLVAASAALMSFATFGGIRAITPDNYGGNEKSWQLQRAGQIRKAVSNTTAKVVFIGDSITHFWESAGKEQWKKYFSEGELRAVNLGISGDRTENVLWRIGEGGELDGYEAKCAVVMIGTNNTGHFKREDEPVGDTILGIRAILNKIREKQPKAKIVLCAIFPRGKDMDDRTCMRNDLVNKEIMKFADGKDIFWCDFNAQFLDEKGDMIKSAKDRCHPTAEAYRDVWVPNVLPLFQKFVGK